MKFGILSGITWGLDTVVLSIALMMIPFLGAPESSIATAFLHDAVCALILLVYMGVRGRIRDTIAALGTHSGKAVIAGGIIGGPLAFTGYVIAINNIGPGYTAILTSFYPAFGTLLAFLLLGERMRPRQLVAFAVALAGVVALGWSSVASDTTGNAMVGVLAALMSVVGWGSEAVILAWGMRDELVDNETALQIRETTSALVYALVVAPIFGALAFSGAAAFTPATAVLALAAVAGTASYLFYYKAISLIGAARSMALNISYSAWAVVFGLLLLGTVPTLLVVVSCVVILVGTALAASSDWSELRFSRKAPDPNSAV